MGSLEFTAFSDELQKIAKLLSRKERGEAIRGSLIGSVAMPIVMGASGLVRGGKAKVLKNITQDTPLGRWLASSMLSGALISGALPTIRHRIERAGKAK